LDHLPNTGESAEIVHELVFIAFVRVADVELLTCIYLKTLRTILKSKLRFLELSSGPNDLCGPNRLQEHWSVVQTPDIS